MIDVNTIKEALGSNPDALCIPYEVAMTASPPYQRPLLWKSGLLYFKSMTKAQLLRVPAQYLDKSKYVWDDILCLWDDEFPTTLPAILVSIIAEQACSEPSVVQVKRILCLVDMTGVSL